MFRTLSITLLIAALVLLPSCSTASPPSATPTRVPTPSSPTTVQEATTSTEAAEILFDYDHAANNLTLDSGGDVDTELVFIGDTQEPAFRTGNGRVLPSPDGNSEQDWYMQFQVDDEVLYGGSPTSRVQIEIEYLDDGTDNFNIQYDAESGGPEGDGRFKESDLVTKTNSGMFKTAVFVLSDAYFANRDNGADFRISDHSDGAETIRRVTITLISAPSEVAQSPTDSPKPLPADHANMIFHNGTILTMEDGTQASAIAIRYERILDVGSDEEMFTYIGPDTAIIDLEGRTLMPGFIDAHSHVFNNPWREDFAGGQQLLLSQGITTSAEMFVEENLIQEMQAFDRQGLLRMRVSLYPIHVDNCGGIRGPWYVPNYPVSREPGALLQIPGVKMFNDGGSCNVPAVSYEYVGGMGQGDLYFQVEQLAGMIVAAQNQGYQVAIHGLGDRALEVNLDAFELALAGGPNSYHHRIEHNTVLRDDMLPRYREVNVVAVIFGFFPTCAFAGDTSQFKYFPPEEYLDWEWRWRPLIDTNPDVHIAWHSDTPYSIGPFPMEHLQSFVTRTQSQDDGTVCEPPDWAADDLLSVEEALPIMTIEGAYALLRQDEIGSLKSGKLADLIVLSANPIEVDPRSIAEIQILLTMVGGKVEHCVQAHERLCPGFSNP